MLTTCQTNAIAAFVIFSFAIVLLASSFSADMLIYDEGNVYSCPVDYLQKSLPQKYEMTDDEGKSW